MRLLSESKQSNDGQVCIKDLVKLNLILWFDFKLDPIFTIATSLRKNYYLQSGQK